MRTKTPTFAHTFTKKVLIKTKLWFRSSVGLEQQPSKLWVLGSSPNGITLTVSHIYLCLYIFDWLLVF